MTHDRKSVFWSPSSVVTHAEMLCSSRLLNHLQTFLPQSTKTTNSRVLVFALYKLEATRLTQTLERNGYSVSSLNGSLSQHQRIAALEDFKSGRTRLMVATDVAARGLDIPEVEVVINYTFPLTVEDYVHRIGRTGKQGFHPLARKAGLSIIDYGVHRSWRSRGQVYHLLHR